MPVMLGADHVAWVGDAAGDDEIVIAPLPGTFPAATTDSAASSAAPTALVSPAKSAAPHFAAHSAAVSHPHTPVLRELAAGRIGRVAVLAAAPDGSRLAVATSDGRLLLVAADTGAVRELVRSSYGPLSGLAFSPDSAWLAWSQAVANKSLRRIRLVECVEPELIYDVSTGRFEDEGPCFTRDGRFLVFLSWRGFDPVHDVHTGDMSFPLGCRPYLVPLAADVLAPFSTPVEGRAPDGTAYYEPPGDDTVRVDPQDMAERLVPFPVIASKYSDPAAVEGGVVWLRWPISGALGQTFANPEDLSGQPSLEYFNLDLCES
jgi:tricorn protease